ncbi:hypothetical protein [Stenotrophomonas maltophilia]|uniref:hypothetical protein n=1 Tax=Stenotrophomonas maltophilia TaxID=40324 RepID=UPI0021B0DAD1|nr:hypothetical protein [Stenotrophomonas maltophilia]
MRVHDARAAWADVMSVLHIEEYWSLPGLQTPPQAYWHASRAFVAANGIRLPDGPGSA